MMNASELIDDLRSAANALAETDRPEEKDRQLKLDQMGNVICRMRNALQSIAKNQGGMPSHVAQQALLDCGYCAHFNMKPVTKPLSYPTSRLHKPPTYFACSDCGKSEPERFESWE